jgi:hypothetical protein
MFRSIATAPYEILPTATRMMRVDYFSYKIFFKAVQHQYRLGL